MLINLLGCFYSKSVLKKQLAKAFFLTALFILAVQPAASQQIDIQNYVITNLGLEEGLPQSTVSDIIQTKDGYIWLATYGGLVRFDGVSFTTFNRSNTTGMRSDRIISLFEQSNGTLWLSTEDGLIKKQSGEFTTYLIIVDSQVFAPSIMKEDSSGQLWIVAGGILFKFKENEFIEVPIIKNKKLAEEALLNPNGVWLGFAKSVVRTLGDSTVLVYDFENALESNIMDFVEYPKHSGTYFIGTDGNGVARYKEGEFTHYNVEDGLASRYTWEFDVDQSNKLWVTSYNGQAIWDGNKFIPFNAIKTQEDIQFTSVYEDDEGNYWIGTTGEGLFKVRHSIITTIDIDQGLRNEKMLSLSRLRDGTTVFATNCGGLYEWKDGRAVPSKINEYLPNQCVWSVFEDSEGYIWFGAKELYRSKSLEEPGTMFGDFNGFDGTDIFTITEDSKGNIWIGCFNGVFVYDGVKFERYTTEDGLAYNDTRAFFEDEDGKMWIGSSSGLSIMHNSSIQKVKLRGEAALTVNSPEPYIRAIHKDEEGIMWFGTYGDGIYRLKNGEVRNITTNDGLYDNIVSHIVEDDAGNFWMGSNRGISRVNREQINAYLDEKEEKIISYSYGTADGMNSVETNGGFEPNVLPDSLGNLYFPTISGVSVVSTQDVQINKNPPKIHIESIRSGIEQIPLAKNITLSYDNPYLEIGYTALSYSNPEKILFRYIMEGLDEDWFEAGNRRNAMYTKLPPGEYIFKVIASNNHGVWNNEGASIQVSVIPPFWETNWFYAIVALLFLATGPSVYYLRVKNLEKENKQQKRFTEQLIESQEQERRRIANELHDGLGQQILVIKNRAELALQQIDDHGEMANQLQEIMQSAVSSISDVRNISYALRPVHLEKFGLTEAISNLCYQLQGTTKMEWSYHVDDIDNVIPKGKEIYFYRVIQEGINNILKHSGAGEATVMVKKSSAGINATVWDDGKGFDVKMQDSISGLGFLGMQERIKNLSGTLDVQSEKGEGTVIKIYIPVTKHG